MTSQEIYDRVKAHLLKQGEPCFGDSDALVVCAYRNGEGLRCAVGCLIDDAHYDANIEGSSACDPDVLKVLRASIGPVSKGAVDLLCSLQEVHDDSDPEEWPELLMSVATRAGLQP